MADVIEKGILPKAQSTFATGLWWIKSRKSDTVFNNHQLVDSVRPGEWQLASVVHNETDADSNYIAPGLECVGAGAPN